MKRETKGGLAPQSTVSGLIEERFQGKMHTSIWKNSCMEPFVCLPAGGFSSSENIYLKKTETESIYSNAIFSFTMF